MSSTEREVIVLKTSPDSVYSLCRTKGSCHYFFIRGTDCMNPMLYVPFQLKFNSARILAIRLFDAYIEGLKSFDNNDYYKRYSL